jgi:hypothetical protein
MRRFAAVLAALFVAASVSAQEKKADAVKQGTLKQVLENEKVKVYEVTYKPGEGSANRERAPRVTHAVSGGTMLRTLPDGKTEKRPWKTGETKWLPKETFANKNVGKTTVKFLIVEPK